MTLIRELRATKRVSPAPRKEPDITTWEVWSQVMPAINRTIIAPSSITSASCEKSETKKYLPVIKHTHSTAEIQNTIRCPAFT